MLLVSPCSCERLRLSSIGMRISPADLPEYCRHKAELQAALDAGEFVTAYEAGRALDWAQTIMLAAESQY